jgi:hypothetical protein
MIINLWSTPRTGSSWYASYLFNEHKKINHQTQIFHQYLNYFHFINYSKPNHTDWVYEFQIGCTYPHYQFDVLKKAINHFYKSGKRTKTPDEEENYRIELLEKHDHNKFPVILHNHVMPMSKKSYEYLYRKADKNVFLYRENLVDQLSSYALAYQTTIWKPKKNLPVFKDIKTDEQVIKNLYDRIIYWHNLDKTDCEIVKYEDINFNDHLEIKIPKQNYVKPFTQLHQDTQNYILQLNEEFSQFISLQKTLLPY